MANKYQCKSCKVYFTRDRAGDECQKCGHTKIRWANGDKTVYQEISCSVCNERVVPARHDQATCLSAECMRENTLRKQRIANKRNNGKARRTYAEKNCQIVSDCYRIIPTDPFNADNISPCNGLPMTHIWNCIEAHP